jgi:hypothetical protein
MYIFDSLTGILRRYMDADREISGISVRRMAIDNTLAAYR